MKRLISLTLCFLTLFTLTLTFTGCKEKPTEAGQYILRICNCEDYISENEQTGETLYEEFERVYEEEHGVDITIEYTTYGTNEILYNNLKINPGSYDLVCPSDYMIQKMLEEGMLEKFDNVKADVPNYEAYGSPYVKSLFEENGWAEYSIPYMWGTMGFIYNPEFVSEEEASTWYCSINPKFQGKTTIKDSVRDTFFLGVALAKLDDLKTENLKYQNDINYSDEYHEYLKNAFNDTSKQTVNAVEQMLVKAKENAFTIEVDSGKDDMVTGKVWINFAWSGDAVYALDEAENDDIELYYAVPMEGSNVWFDGWVMPTGANKTLASAFLNYISSPEKAIENMEYIGYTSAIAGQDVLNWAKEYDPAEDDDGYEVDLSYFFSGVDGVVDSDAIIEVSTLGRQFSTQYPSRDVVDRCAVMKYFSKEDDELINAMWNRVKAGNIKLYVIIIIVSVCTLAILFALYFIYVKDLFRKTGIKGYTAIKKEEINR
ncbi:MAG: extracellular solute-binding protein [Clostridia bacterium]|nr:extracellular solute-binding protein [Clostridia bacterium]